MEKILIFIISFIPLFIGFFYILALYALAENGLDDYSENGKASSYLLSNLLRLYIFIIITGWSYLYWFYETKYIFFFYIPEILIYWYVFNPILGVLGFIFYCYYKDKYIDPFKKH